MRSTSSTSIETKAVLLGLGGWLLLQIWIVFRFDGTYDAGDSVMHYLFARHAFSHPEHFIDHWAKPFFTLLAAPAAQLGWVGMKLFQCVLALASAWLAYRLARKLGFRMAWMAPVLTLLAPEFFLAQFSGLTEPLFGCLLLAGVLALTERRLLLGALLLGFLPLVRTEGLLLLPVFGLFLLTRRAWLPFLASGLGLVAYSVLGGIFLGDLGWIFTQNPYDQGLENYGKGDWGHYLGQYVFVAGVPIYALTALGVVLGLLPNLIKTPLLPRNPQFSWAECWLLHVPFAVYFGSHVFFWATGTGHSLGMSRVMIALVPVGAVIALGGWHVMLGWVPAAWTKLRWGLSIAVAAYVLVFPFTANPAALRLPDDLSLEMDQVLMRDAVAWMQENKVPLQPVFVTHPSYALFAGIDPFDSTQRQSLQPLGLGVPSGSIVIWDSWFSVKEDGTYPEYWVGMQAEFTELFKAENSDGKEHSEVRIYRKN